MNTIGHFDESQWRAICPFEHRLKSEGGNTDITRLDAECPNWKSILDWGMGHRGVIIRGETGTCKTRAMWRLLRKVFDSQKYFSVATCAQFERECRDACGKGELSKYIREYISTPVLFIDDVGKAMFTDFVQNSFFEVIDERTQNGKPILATTNDSGRTLAARLSPDRGDAIVRRLRDYCDVFVFRHPAKPTSK